MTLISPDTEDSVAEFRRSVEASRWKPKPAVSEAVQRKIEAKKLKASGMKLRRVRAADGSVKEVWCYSASYHAMGFEDHQIHAAERFGRDWEGAYRGLRGQGFDPGVDGGSSAHRFHTGQVQAQTRLAECKAYLGTRAWEIVVAVAIHGATVTGMARAAGAKDSRSIRGDLAHAFNDLDAFYTKSRRKDRTWEAFERFNQERAQMIAQAEREVG